MFNVAMRSFVPATRAIGHSILSHKTLRALTTLVTMPTLSPSMKEATITDWNKQNGDSLECYEILFSLSTSTLEEHTAAADGGEPPTELVIESQDDGTIEIVWG